jgi:hypothetical protein
MFTPGFQKQINPVLQIHDILGWIRIRIWVRGSMPLTSVPDLDPPDPHVFGPPGSGSTSQRDGSGSGSFYHHAKIVRKTLIPTILGLLLTFYL